ncbi:hypothetical protein ACPCAG_31355 [Streptomyces pseudogriseolus]|uniref:hypothetical protein n=1 Tax=Streptomyces pseudogriseolus TaxID=36817 RepID=UPI003FA27FAD
MRMPRFFRRPRPAAILAAGAAVVILAGASVAVTPDTTPAAAPRPARTATVNDTATADIVGAYNAGWIAGVADLGDGTKPTAPKATGDANHPGTVAWADGWIDGQADALGDDNRDGIVDEDESGWDCRTMGNRQCGTPPQCRGEIEFADVCATVADRPAYAWTDEDGTPHSVANGRELLAQIDAKPGTEEFAAALFALDTQWVQHNEN